MLSKIVSGWQFEMFLILFSQKTGLDISWKLSPIKTICMKCQSLFKKKYITKTCLYNVDPHKPHFYIVKLGFTGVYIIFLISAQNIDCGYSSEPPRRGGSNEYPQSMICADVWKNIRISVYLNRLVFKMTQEKSHQFVVYLISPTNVKS